MSEYIMECNLDAQVGEYAYKRKAEIVRCRDCKHYDRMNGDESMCMVPDGDGDYARWIVDDDGYCYLGERRG